ncbi:uncharacterized protein LOC134815422 [Bolinopsis microptera]|uniref:uncharacterized protein LOC134815422 n=2 Tax=Bolinopsis microptera TaxID=2820187 RepID=UPI003078EADB
MITGRGGRIDDLTSGEQTRQPGNETSEAEPPKDKPQVCEWCGKGFKQVAKHQWRCKLRPQDELRAAENTETEVDVGPAEGDRYCKSELKSSPESNHSATMTEACSASFSAKDKPPEQIELKDTLKLSLPQANKMNEWKGIDEDLSIAIGNIVKGKDPEKELKTMELTIYEYLADRYGQEERKPYLDKPNKEGPVTKTLRKKKKDTAREYREAVREGGVTSGGAKAVRAQYWRLVRIHNKSRREQLKKRKKKEKKKETQRFRRNPYDYSKRLLDEKISGEPTFGKEEADRYYPKEYMDRDRCYVFEKMAGIPDAKDPVYPFVCTVPTYEEFEKKIKTRRNGSSPGPNGVPYIVYKRCARLRELLYACISKLWLSNSVPLQWRIGESILLPKTTDLSDPGKFRNITMTNTSGKVAMGMLADKMLDYMTTNKYIDTSVQKGFLRKMPGCIEHTQALMEELRDAKSKRRQVYAVWVDLMNAYGRVPHELIVFALRHYKFPEEVVQYIVKYYDELVVRVKTKKWKSEWFYYLIGLFQGDPLSVVLFLIAFNLLLDLLQVDRTMGYKPSFSSEPTTNRAFADDLTLLSDRLDKMKRLVGQMEEFLAWTRTMRAKPSKCIALGMKVVDNTYRSFDPEIIIANEKVAYLGDTPIKFLGHWIYVNLGQDETRELITTQLSGQLEKVDMAELSGPSKCWIYNHMLTSKVQWNIMIYNLPVSFIQTLEALCTRYLKKWLGVTTSISNSVLYRSKDHFGLSLKQISNLYKCLQVSKAYMLKTSVDPKVREVFEYRENTNRDKKRWDYTKELTNRERDLYFKELIGYVQTREGAGIGFGDQRRKKNKKEQLVEIIKSLKEEELLQTLYDKRVQGKFLTWKNTMQLDTGWQSLLYTLSPELTKFHLNAIHDVASTPSNLQLWNYSSTNNCPLCGRQQCNLKHILTCCPVSLKQGRYNWRHDQVLRVIVQPIAEKLREINSATPKTEVKREWRKFVSGKGTYRKPEVRLTEEPHLLEEGNDWKLVFDEDERTRQFPQHIVNTALRPDVVIYSNTLRKVILIELTCGNEENFEDQRSRKEKRYEELMVEIETAGWEGYLFTVEVGCRGFYHHTLPRIFNFLNITRAKKKRALNTTAVVSLKGSYTIWLSRYNKTWSDNWQLAERPCPV